MTLIKWIDGVSSLLGRHVFRFAVIILMVHLVSDFHFCLKIICLSADVTPVLYSVVDSRYTALSRTLSFSLN